jgi:hypothetical protein
LGEYFAGHSGGLFTGGYEHVEVELVERSQLVELVELVVVPDVAPPVPFGVELPVSVFSRLGPQPNT